MNKPTSDQPPAVEPAQRCNCCGYLVTDSEHRGCLRAAKQEPAQAVPVAWRTFDGEGGYEFRSYDENETYQDDFIKSNGAKYSGWVEPLYTHPAQLDSDTRKMVLKLCRNVMQNIASWSLVDDAEAILEKLEAGND